MAHMTTIFLLFYSLSQSIVGPLIDQLSVNTCIFNCNFIYLHCMSSFYEQSHSYTVTNNQHIINMLVPHTVQATVHSK